MAQIERAGTPIQDGSALVLGALPAPSRGALRRDEWAVGLSAGWTLLCSGARCSIQAPSVGAVHFAAILAAHLLHRLLSSISAEYRVFKVVNVRFRWYFQPQMATASPTGCTCSS
jgi:hypothetical protein